MVKKRTVTDYSKKRGIVIPKNNRVARWFLELPKVKKKYPPVFFSLNESEFIGGGFMVETPFRFTAKEKVFLLKWWNCL